MTLGPIKNKCVAAASTHVLVTKKGNVFHPYHPTNNSNYYHHHYHIQITSPNVIIPLSKDMNYSKELLFQLEKSVVLLVD